MKEPRTVKEAALLAIEEAAELCVYQVELDALARARHAYEQGDYAGAIWKAISAAYAAGMGREKFDRNKSQGNRSEAARAYRADVASLARFPRVPDATYAALAERHHKDKDSIKREVRKARAALRGEGK